MSRSDTPHDAPLDLAAEQARLARAEAEFAELKEALARGDLVPLQAVQKRVAAGIERVRAKMLELHEKMAPRMIGVTQADAEAMLMEAVREALKELDAVAEAAVPEDDPEAA